jgi:hypothetical protein
MKGIDFKGLHTQPVHNISANLKKNWSDMNRHSPQPTCVHKQSRHQTVDQFKYSINMEKKNYVSPKVDVIPVKTEMALLNWTAGTSSPQEGGDPTGSGGGTTDPNPFGSAKQTSLWESDLSWQ